jgi:hypothetical protein
MSGRQVQALGQGQKPGRTPHLDLRRGVMNALPTHPRAPPPGSNRIEGLGELALRICCVYRGALEAGPRVSVTRSAVILIRVCGAAIVRVPAVNALALADAGHQLATAHRGSGLADGIASGRGASARAAIRRKAGTWCCQRKHRCKCDCRAQGPQIFHCYSHPLWFDAMPASVNISKTEAARRVTQEVGWVSQNPHHILWRSM